MESFLIQVQIAKLSEIDSLLGYGGWSLGWIVTLYFNIFDH